MESQSDRDRRFKEAMEASKTARDILKKALIEFIATEKELRALAVQMSSMPDKVDASVQTDTIILEDKDVQTIKNEVLESSTQTDTVTMVNKDVQTYFERAEEESKPRKMDELCFNCHSTAHNYGECPYQTLRSFCFQCGMSEVTVKDCPRCTSSWKAQNPNFSGGSDYASRNRLRQEMRDRYRGRHRVSPFSRPAGSRPTPQKRKRRF